MPSREFELDEADAQFLDENYSSWEAKIENKVRWLIIRNFELPDGYVKQPTSVAIRVPDNYPCEPLDMAYFYPEVRKTDGTAIAQTQGRVAVEGLQYQQWSRHYTGANPWVPGEDSLITHMMAVHGWLSRELR